jgi:hypothetical protein
MQIGQITVSVSISSFWPLVSKERNGQTDTDLNQNVPMRTRELTSERFPLTDVNLKLTKSTSHILHHKIEILVAESYDTLAKRRNNIYLQNI